MLNIYIKKSDRTSLKKVEKWLKEYGISYQILFPQEVTSELLWKLLNLVEGDVFELLRSRARAKKMWRSLDLSEGSIEKMSIKDFVLILEKNPFLLKTPIFFNDRKIVIGYSADEIRTFIPKDYRREQMRLLRQ